MDSFARDSLRAGAFPAAPSRTLPRSPDPVWWRPNQASHDHLRGADFHPAPPGINDDVVNGILNQGAQGVVHASIVVFVADDDPLSDFPLCPRHWRGRGCGISHPDSLAIHRCA